LFLTCLIFLTYLYKYKKYLKKFKNNLYLNYIMDFNLKYTIFMYLIILFFLFMWKPNLFMINIENKKRKLLYLTFLVVIIAIISFYFKVLMEWFF